MNVLRYDRGNCITVLMAGAIVLTVAAAPSIGDYIPAGNDQALWLVRTNEDNSYDIAVQIPPGGEWKIVDRQAPGHPATIAAVDRQAHLLTNPPMQYIIHRPGAPGLIGRNPQDPLWPAMTRPAAMAESIGFGADAGPNLIVAAPRFIAPVQTQATDELDNQSNDKPQAPELSPAQQATIGIFQNAQGHWKHLFDLENVEYSNNSKLFLAVSAGKFYLLHQADEGSPARLLTRQDDQWVELPPLPSGQVVRMLTVLNRLVIVQSFVQEGLTHMAMVIVNPTDNIYARQIIRDNDTPATWQADAQIVDATTTGEQVAILWIENNQLNLASSDLTGMMIAHGAITVLDTPMLTGRGEEILSFFVVTVFIIAILITFSLRSKLAARGPFSLPANAVPAPLGKRLVAAMLDLLPMTFISSAIFLSGAFGDVPQLTIEDIQHMAYQQGLPNFMAYFVVTALALYAAYCFVMELRYGATLGKMAMRIKVIGDDGERPAPAQLLLRNLVKIVELAWPPVGLPILLLLPLLNRNRQRLGDMFARTTVVDSKPLPLPPPPQHSDKEASEINDSNQ